MTRLTNTRQRRQRRQTQPTQPPTVEKKPVAGWHGMTLTQVPNEVDKSIKDPPRLLRPSHFRLSDTSHFGLRREDS